MSDNLDQLFRQLVEQFRERRRAGDKRVLDIRRKGNRVTLTIQLTRRAPIRRRTFDLRQVQNPLEFLSEGCPRHASDRGRLCRRRQKHGRPNFHSVWSRVRLPLLRLSFFTLPMPTLDSFERLKAYQQQQQEQEDEARSQALDSRFNASLHGRYAEMPPGNFRCPYSLNVTRRSGITRFHYFPTVRSPVKFRQTFNT